MVGFIIYFAKVRIDHYGERLFIAWVGTIDHYGERLFIAWVGTIRHESTREEGVHEDFSR